MENTVQRFHSTSFSVKPIKTQDDGHGNEKDYFVVFTNVSGFRSVMFCSNLLAVCAKGRYQLLKESEQ